MNKYFLVLLSFIICCSTHTFAQSLGTMNLQGPSNGGTQITRAATVNDAVNAAISSKVDVGAVGAQPITANGVTQTAAGWMGYLSGTANPYPLLAGSVAISGSLTIPTTTPASSSSACTQGQIEFDSTYVYTCVATNTWRRAATSSF